MIPSTAKVILFDIYGTLLDGPRFDNRRERMESIATQFNLAPGDAIEAALDQAIAAAHRESPEPWPEIDIRRVWQSVFPLLDDPDAFAIAAEDAVHPVTPTPWANDLLTDAIARGAMLGIVSNAQAYTRHLMHEHFPSHWPSFDERQCAFSYQYRIAKPDLRLYRQVVDPLIADGIRPEEIIMVGDSDTNDREPAEELGLGFVGVGPLSTS